MCYGKRYLQILSKYLLNEKFIQVFWSFGHASACHDVRFPYLERAEALFQLKTFHYHFAKFCKSGQGIEVFLIKKLVGVGRGGIRNFVSLG